MRQTLDDALIAPEQLFAGADPAVLDALKSALATGDMAKLKAAVTRLSTKAKIKVVGGEAGAKVKYDADTRGRRRHRHPGRRTGDRGPSRLDGDHA